MDHLPPKKSDSGQPDADSLSEVSESLDIAVAPVPAADEAVKEALNIAESVGMSEGDFGDNLGLEFGDAGDGLSLNQIIDQAEQRSRPLFEQASSADHEPLEELDALEIAAQFGRPSEEPVGRIEDTREDSVDGFNDTKDLTLKVAAEPDRESPPPISPPQTAAPVPKPPSSLPQATFGVPTHSEIPRPPDDLAHGGTEPLAPVQPVMAIPRAEATINSLGTPVEDTLPREKTGENEVAEVRALIARKISTINEGTYFDILEVPSTASEMEVKEAYGDLRRQFRADIFQDSTLSDMKKEVSLIRTIVDEAYEVLRKPDLRELYRRAALDGGD